MRWVLSFALAAILGAGCLESPGAEPQVLAGIASTILCDSPCDAVVAAPGFALVEPVISVNPSNPLHMVVGGYGIAPSLPISSPVGPLDPTVNSNSLWSHATFDGGATWRSSRLPGGPREAPTHPLFPFDSFVHPALQILKDGTVVYAGVAFNGQEFKTGPANPYTFSNTHIFVARSLDGGLTWPNVQIIAKGVGVNAVHVSWSGSPQTYNNDPSLARGPDGTLILAWTQATYPGNTHPDYYYEQVNIVAATSRDGGATWKSTSPVADTNPGIFAYPVAAVAPDGALHVAYFSEIPGPRKAMHARSSDGGASWKTSVIGPAGRGHALVVNSQGQLFFTATNHSKGMERPILFESRDAGQTWSDPKNLDEPEAAGLALPTIAVDGNDTLYAAFYHPLPEGMSSIRVVRFEGDDFGAVGNASLKPFSAVAGHYETFYQRGGKGAYMGLAGLPDGVFAAWISGIAPSTAIHGSRMI